MNRFFLRKSTQGWLLLILLLGIVLLFDAGLFPQWSLKYPMAWRIPLRYWITDLMHWLVNDTPSLINLTGITFKEITRFIATILTYPLDFSIDLLSTGFR
ncbi:MAG: hypothetical protein OSB18_15110, partial [SAR324 cluster bacterium]|nr:hypothetical protein [SAR324 cluster bacterium]